MLFRITITHIFKNLPENRLLSVSIFSNHPTLGEKGQRMQWVQIRYSLNISVLKVPLCGTLGPKHIGRYVKSSHSSLISNLVYDKNIGGQTSPIVPRRSLNSSKARKLEIARICLTLPYYVRWAPVLNLTWVRKGYQRFFSTGSYIGNHCG